MELDREHFERIRALFDVVIDLAPGQQRARLSELESSQSIIAEVMGLLNAAPTGHTSAITRAVRPMGQFLVETVGSEDLPGVLLGPWQLQEVIAQGGMGRVYKAVRADGHFQQTAAVKVLAGVATASALEQLAQERQLLANLNHPNIAKLLDGGATAKGHPYLVMEFIEGKPIDEWVQGEQDTELILQMFLQITGAIAFAHRQLIIHCDIKPSNVLVDASGRAVVLDFGIGGLLGDSGKHSIQRIAYSKNWASPEQQNGEPLTTATDVYSLGALLRDLLGERINGELRAVCSMATMARPSDRYPSVDSLTEDIKNYLQKLPVRALPRSLVYVGGKLLRRRWLWFASAAAFLIATLTLGIQILAERDRAITANALAEKERSAAVRLKAQAEKERAAALIAKSEADTERGNAQRQRDVAKSAEASARKSESAAKESETQALSAAKLAQAQNQYVSNIFLGVGKPGFDRNKVTAMDMLEDASANLLSKASDDLPTFARVQLAYTVGSGYLAIGQNSKAEKLYLLAIELCDDPVVTSAQRKSMRGTIAIDLAKINYNAQKFTAAAKFARIAQADLPPLTQAMKQGRFDSEIIPRAFLTLMSATPMDWMSASKSMAEIEASLRRAGHERQTADALFAVLRYGGVMHFSVGQFEQAIAYERRAIEQGKLIEALPVSNNAEARRPGIEWAWLGLGQAQLGDKRFAEAVESLRNALREAGEGQAAGAFGAIANNALARALAELGHLDESLGVAQIAVDQAKTAFGEASTRTAVAWATLATTQSLRGMYATADENFAKGIRIAQESKVEGWISAISQTRWAQSKLARGDFAGARYLLDAAEGALRFRFPPDHAEAKLYAKLRAALP